MQPAACKASAVVKLVTELTRALEGDGCFP